ncbi:MAG TPA: tetratricopeptide repeat protein [Saprospiraceae bacterium]|nr:tetratricopeptide repeat protein [Saprospiraceae bacterium]
MLKKIDVTLLLWACLTLSNLFGQKAPYDSLLRRCQDENLSERERLDAFLELGENKYHYLYPDSLIRLYQQDSAFLKKAGEVRDHIFQKIYLGEAHCEKEECEKSLAYAEEAEKMARATADTLALIRALEFHGYEIFGSYERQPPLAIKKYLEALRLDKPYGSRTSAILNLLGEVFFYLGDYEKAKEYSLQALESLCKKTDLEEESNALLKIGAIHYHEDNYDEALEYFFQAKELASKSAFTSKYFEGSLLEYIGNAYYWQGDSILAQQYYRKVLEIAKETKSKILELWISSDFADLYQDWYPDSAMYYVNRGIPLAVELEQLDDRSNLMSTQIYLYKNRGEYQKALELQTKYEMLKDSIDQIINENSIYLTEAQYNFEDQKLAEQQFYEQKISRQQQRAKRLIYVFLAGIAVFLLFLLGILKFRQMRRREERQQFLYEIEMLKDRLATQAIALPQGSKKVELDKEKIEEHLGKSLGESSWQILMTIFENPGISNRELASRVYLSLDGLSSALRRMYKAFRVHTESSRNKKVALLTRAVKISLDQG